MRVSVKIGVAALAALLVSACASTGAKSPYDSGELFLPGQDAMADVESALEKARAEDKLALVVLGANWCHDSRALAARLYQPPLAGLIEKQYETVLVDVGYLDQGRDVAMQFGSPIYYATPTVFIVDPKTGQLVNDGDRHQWGSAASIEMNESIEYFERMASAQNAKSMSGGNPALDGVERQIAEYEQRLADKVARGYQRVGPMLRAYKEGGNVPASFEDDWTEVAKFRMSVPATVQSLRAQALEQSSTGSGVKLDFPDITPFSWE